VIGVKVAEDEVVDLLEPGLLGGREDPLGVAIADFPAGIEQQRFAGRRHDQCGRAALDVDPIDLQIPWLSHCCGNRREQECDEPYRPGEWAGHLPS
jgi:hypothetical protein